MAGPTYSTWANIFRQLTLFNCSQSAQSFCTREYSSPGSLSPSSPSSSSPSTSCENQISPDVAQGPAFSPVRSRGITFPLRIFSGKLRSFNPNWYDGYSLIEYSASRNVVFCYPCRLFTTRSGKAEAAFILTGFHDWNHASGKQGVVHHDKCAIHKGAVLSREECKRNAACGPSLASQLVAG